MKEKNTYPQMRRVSDSSLSLFFSFFAANNTLSPHLKSALPRWRKRKKEGLSGAAT
jgi:hypothetical protein